MSKLYLLSGPKFELPFLVDSGHHVMTIPADNLPMLYWPDYSWCYEANVFMRMLYERQLSRRTRGGTLHTYGTQISHLLRYCALNKWELEELTDNQFTLFINFLKAERNPYRPSRPRRRFNQVIQIGKKCLEFLECIGRIHGLRNFVGPTGVIRAERKQSTIRLGESGIRNILVRTHWHHRSFPRENPITRRLPIGEDAIERLRAAVEEISPTPYLRMRRYVMLNLLEILGLRRVELACLTVKSVRAAFNSDWPALELITVKSRKSYDPRRVVPISKPDARLLMQFIEVNRAPLIKSTCGKALDDGHLLISERTGQRLTANTITTEIYKLRKAARLRQQTCAQMFRHRFITKQFVALLEQHNLNNKDDFRKALLDSRFIMGKVQEMTGQTLKALERYLHLAFVDVARWQKSVDTVMAQRAIESGSAQLLQLLNGLKRGESAVSTVQRATSLLEDVQKDFDRVLQKR